MKSIGVYLGANQGNNPLIKDAVVSLAQQIVNLGLKLVYGGSSLGLMGLLANMVQTRGGQVVGITTRQLFEKERALNSLTELHIVDSMQERKLLMQQKSDGFLVMPGGLGTLEEALETWNAIKIGLINKPIGFFNHLGYFDKLFSFIKACGENGFILDDHVRIPYVSGDIMSLMDEIF